MRSGLAGDRVARRPKRLRKYGPAVGHLAPERPSERRLVERSVEQRQIGLDEAQADSGHPGSIATSRDDRGLATPPAAVASREIQPSGSGRPGVDEVVDDLEVLEVVRQERDPVQIGGGSDGQVDGAAAR